MCNSCAVMHYQNASGERHHGAHHVLDQQNCKASVAIQLFQDCHDAIGLGRAQPRHYFIEQQQFRISGQRARHFEPLAVRQRQRRGPLGAFFVKLKPTQHIVRMCARRNDIMTVEQRPHDDVVLDGKCRKWPYDLKGAADAATANLIGRKPVDPLVCKGDRPAVWRETLRQSC